MFERYTDRARRVIFFSRYEASQFGSTTIESEHLLLGLLREDKNLTNRFVRNASAVEAIRQDIERRTTIREKVSTSIDLPLSNECKRILAYAHEEADRLNHRFVGTEHLLLGILREEKCVAATLLQERGLQLETIREELARSGAQQDAATSHFPEDVFSNSPPADRPTIHALVDKVPEASLGWLKVMMERILSQPESERAPFPSKAARLLDRLRSITGAGIGGGHFKRDTAGKMVEGRSSSSTRQEDGTLVVETHQFLAGHQISTTERFRMSEDGKTLSYSVEIVGPKPEQQHKHAMEFDVS